MILPKVFSNYNETFWDYVLVVSDVLVEFWDMWLNFQGHQGQIGQLCSIWVKGDFHNG